MPLHKATLEAVEQAQRLIARCQSIYNIQPDHAMSPIGKHIRHIVDHLTALQQGYPLGCIDYNIRHRNTVLDTDPVLAQQTLAHFSHWLTIDNCPNKALTVISEISVNHCESSLMQSNLNRELGYIINHTLHHVAYASLLAKTLGVKVDAHLGVAPATASYLRHQKSAACVP